MILLVNKTQLYRPKPINVALGELGHLFTINGTNVTRTTISEYKINSIVLIVFTNRRPFGAMYCTCMHRPLDPGKGSLESRLRHTK